jgi:hypothetical protein
MHRQNLELTRDLVPLIVLLQLLQTVPIVALKPLQRMKFAALAAKPLLQPVLHDHWFRQVPVTDTVSPKHSAKQVVGTALELAANLQRQGLLVRSCKYPKCN